jgi:hypothetical protein
MKPIAIVVVGLFLVVPRAALSGDREAAVRTAITAFYKAFDDGFVGPAVFATEDWNHINPYGGAIRAAKQRLRRYAEFIKLS